MPEDASKPAPSSTVTSIDGTLRSVTQGGAPPVPERLGPFRVEVCIGRGGLGVVYRAYDQKLRRPVALKVLTETSSAAALRLLDEARAAAALTHPNIAAVYDVQEQRGVSFIVMELVEGTTLREEIRRGPLPLERALRHARDIAAGLTRAHDGGIVHRDLKPENVMVTREGAVKILDFGLAREAPDAPPESGDGARTGIAGTPGYMAPEQARGRRVDARADVWSFGVVLWEMLSGRRPTDRVGGLDRAALALPVPGLTPALSGVVERCLQADPSARFADAAELLEALSELDAAPAAGTEPAGRARWPAVAAPVAALGALAAVASWVALRPASAGGNAVSPPGSAPPSIVTAAAPALAVTSAPEQLTSAGLCSDFPAFAGDGSVVYYSRRDDRGISIRRLDLASGADVALTDDSGNSLRPAAGHEGSVVYLFQRRGEQGGSEVREVPLAGGVPSTLVHGADAVFSPGAAALYYLGGEGHSIQRRVEGGADAVLYEAPSSMIFDSLAVSPGGRWIAASRTSSVPRPAVTVCFAPLGAVAAPLDCKSAGSMTSRRPTFGGRAGALYFSRDAAIVRFDPATRATESAPLPVAPENLAVAPDGASVVFSTCRTRYRALRVEPDGSLRDLPAAAQEAGLLNVGPGGELAFSVARDGAFALGVTDPAGARVRVLTDAEHAVIEVSFSPDGRRLAFHDATAGSGGIFVADVDGATQPTRLTTDDGDDLPGWLDDEHVLFMRPEKGLPYGRAYVVDAAGGEPRPLPRLPGVLLGANPSRGTLLMAVRSPAGDHFVEATPEGKLRDIALRGVPRGLHWDIATAASPSGRYVGWYAGGKAWRADLEAGTAAPVDFAWPPGDADAIQPDDSGRVTVAFRTTEGQLYRVRGTFP